MGWGVGMLPDSLEANGLAYSGCPANTNDLASPLPPPWLIKQTADLSNRVPGYPASGGRLPGPELSGIFCGTSEIGVKVAI